MSGSLLIVLVVSVGAFCLLVLFAIALVRVAALADERDDALLREAALDRLGGERGATGRRLFARADSRRAVEEALREMEEANRR